MHVSSGSGLLLPDIIKVEKMHPSVAPGDKYAKSESCRVHVLMTSRGMKESVL